MARLAILLCLTMLGPPVAAAAAQSTRVKGTGAARPAATSATPRESTAGKAPEAGGAPQAPAPQAGAKEGSAARDSGYTIPAGQEGAVFRSLTVEGEDRVHLDFERPALTLELDPTKAPGLDWGSARDVLNRTVPDLASPLVRSSSHKASPYVAHPWLAHFATGAVARFRPQVEGVERWKLTIVNARGETVASYMGRGSPPREIAWDGRTLGGSPVTPGLTYSYVLEARDRAGNKRNFVGEGFQVSAYRLDSVERPLLVFSGRELPTSDPTRPASSPSEREATAPILLEAASWLNQSSKAGQPVRVTATARTLEQAQALSALVVRQITPHVLGDPARIEAVPEVQPDAPEGGALRIAAGR